MLNFPNLEKLHHAYMIFAPVSRFDNIRDNLRHKFAEQSAINLAIADFVNFSYKSMGVSDVQEIVDFNARVPIGDKKIAIISAENITVPAQNTLLKIVEEPNIATHFFFLVPSKTQMLETFLSRTHELSIVDNEKQISKEVENFLNQSTANRLAITKEMLVFLEKEKMTRGEICEFISKSIKLAHSKYKGEKKFNKSQLRSLVSIEHFMRDTSSSMKLCLEYLALSL